MDNIDHEKEYKYSAFQLVGSYLLLPLVSILSLTFGAILLEMNGFLFGVILILSGIWFLFLSGFACLMCSRIITTDSGISAHNFLINSKYIYWKEVIKITKVRRWNPGSRSFQDDFYVFDHQYSQLLERFVNIYGPIAFSGKLTNVLELIGDINQLSQQYKFPLFVIDQETAINLAAKNGLTGWKRAIPTVEEISVTKF